MLLNEPTLTHEEQQKAAERVLELMRQGMSSGQAIQQVANEIRAESASKKED
ncbi:YoaH family protein [Parasalinivibrio latis]|uniref:YoaH family protein n=1 Tax=Parasalinivibrio latis TaxID=2952610 RepID=UPI0030E0D81D